MIDREQAIKVVKGVLAEQQQGPYGEPDDAAQIVDAILALTDPVHEAARKAMDEYDARFFQWVPLARAMDRLRTALADERVPMGLGNGDGMTEELGAQRDRGER